MIRNKVFQNATWIIACKIVQAVVNLVVTMLSARYLGPSGYGLINYAASIVAFIAPVMQLGLNNVLVQEIVNHPEKEGETLGTALVTCGINSFLCIFGVVSFVAVANHGEKTTIIVCALYSILLVFQALELSQYWFQAKLKSKYTSIVMLIAYIITSIYKIVLLITGSSIYWFAVSQAIDYMIIAFVLLIIYKKKGEQRLSFSWAATKRMLAKSRYYIIPNLMISVFSQTDRIMLKLMIGDEATGYYSAAVTCANITAFIFVAIVDSARPSIFESKKNNQAEFENKMIKLYSVIIYFSLLQSLVVSLFAPLIVRVLYGSAYYPSINALRLIVWYTTFSYLGVVRNVWVLAEEKQKYLWILNFAGATMNVLLNLLLIPVWGISGAAFASLVTQFFTNVIMNALVKQIRYSNRLMLKGLNPKVLIDLVKGK